MKLQCQECDKKFNRKNANFNTKCPKCGSYDIDLDTE
jgi:Zn finger protein HypA/HybF involved in hydrogenase expression